MGREGRTKLVLMSPPAPLGLLLVCALWWVPAVLPFVCRLLPAFCPRWPCGQPGVFLLCRFVAALSGTDSAFPSALLPRLLVSLRALLVRFVLCGLGRGVAGWSAVSGCPAVAGWPQNQGLHLRSAL